MISLFRRNAPPEPPPPWPASQDETRCLFVGSKGLQKLCEVQQPWPNDASERWPARALRDHRPGGRIYVHATAFPRFAMFALPRVRSPFVLVSGDSVPDVSRFVLGQKGVKRVLENRHLIRWHAQNLSLDHGKAHAMPLGLDYHTISRNRRPEWGPQAAPMAQEAELLSVRAASAPLAERLPTAYSNWHFALDNGDRRAVLDQLPPEATVFQSDRQPRLATWQQTAQHAFTISPRGNGMDCHRTWEAILLGAAPVIPDLPINGLFKDLPVIVVRDWAQVTPAFLAAERARLLEAEFDFSNVLLETWRRQLFGEPPLPPLRMRYQAFLDLTAEDLRAHIQMP